MGAQAGRVRRPSSGFAVTTVFRLRRKHSTGSAADSVSHYSAQPLCAYVGLALQLITLPTHSYKKLPLIMPSGTVEWPPDSDIIIILSLFFLFFFFFLLLLYPYLVHLHTWFSLPLPNSVEARSGFL